MSTKDENNEKQKAQTCQTNKRVNAGDKTEPHIFRSISNVRAPQKKACYANSPGAGESGGSGAGGAAIGPAFGVGGSLADDGSTLHLTKIPNN